MYPTALGVCVLVLVSAAGLPVEIAGLVKLDPGIVDGSDGFEILLELAQLPSCSKDLVGGRQSIGTVEPGDEVGTE